MDPADHSQLGESSSTLFVPDESTPFINGNKATETDLVFEATLKDAYKELSVLFFDAAPNIAAYFLETAMPLASIFSIGHLGTEQLGAAALSNMFATITGWSLSIGMASSLDTLCSQSFTGSKDPYAVGLHVQRGILVSFAMFVPISFVWWHSEPLMLLLGQDPEVSRLCGVYLRIFLLGIPPFVVFECVKKYLQAQRIMKAQTYVTLAVIPIYLILNYLLILNPTTSLGFIGAPLASVSAFWLMAIFSVLYVVFVDGYRCWGGFSSLAFSGWGIYFKLGVPGIFQVCSEWWAYEIMALSTSYMGTENLAAHSVAASITNTCFSIALGQSIAVSNRIGNLLGSGFPNRARLTSRCALFLSALLPNISVFILLVFRHSLPWLFTSDQSVVDVLQSILPAVAFYQILDCTNAVCGGIMRGQGRQRVGAVANIIAFYVLAIPLGLYAAFALNFGVLGLWLGNTLALTITGISLSILILKTDWAHQVELCRARLGETRHPPQ